MGNLCGLDPFDMLKEKYGQMLVRFIAGQKAKQLVSQKADLAKNQLGNQINQIKGQTFQQIQGQQKQSFKLIQDAKTKLPSNIPPQLGSPDQLFGINAIKKKFEQLKNQVNNKFGESQGNFKRQIDGVALKSIETINKEEPQIPLYSNLSQTHKRMVLKRGEEQFKPQIQQARKKAMDEVGQKLDPSIYLNKIKNIIPMSSITGITDGAKDKINSAMSLVNNEGGFIDSIKKYF